MSGARVSYQVRPNKYVERHIFVELLMHIGKVVNIEDYLYVSMGGRLLEDFKLVHGRLNLTKMMSIEEDNVTYRRQGFNRPLEHINCELMTSEQLVSDFETHVGNYGDTGVIVWLDYASSKERGKQLSEYENLVKKLRAFDVIKITLNASMKTLVTPGIDVDSQDITDLNLAPQEKGLKKLGRQLGDFLDKALIPADLTSQMLPKILADSVGKAAVAGSESDRSTFIEPLTVLAYSDGYHEMLTVTSIVLPYVWGRVDEPDDEFDKGARARAVTDQFRRQARLEDWPFLAHDWPDVHRIAIPDLSVKERLRIHEDLKDHSGDLAAVGKELPFRFGDDKADTTNQAIEMYHKFYRSYPNFLPVVI